MPIYLGIDGGGTRTRAVLVNERGETLGAGEAASSNYHSVGLEAAFANILAAVTAAREQAKLAGDTRIDAACLGLAGCGTAADRAKLAPIAAKLPMVAPAKVRIESDLRIAHAGSFEGGPGVVIIAGTGSVCFGIDAKGNEARAGGWGPAFDDWGSAFDVGRRAISHALRVADGRSPASLLAPRIIEHLGGDLRAIAKLGSTGEDRNRVASLAPIVFAAEREYDTAAAAIVMMIVEELAIMFAAVAAKLSFESEIEVVVHGGLNNAGRPFFQTLYYALRRRDPRVQIVSDMLPPVMGAAMLAMKLGGAKVTDEVLSAMTTQSTNLAPRD